ncbi:MAG: NAD(P)-dependent oxidoreductase [Rhodobacteraceae bacterium]|nr:NAD(P)-dependent oxidoreductase [Paracoccaceae bacterium]
MTRPQRSKHGENLNHIALIGFGEAARAFVSGWAEGNGVSFAAYDIKTDNPATAGAMRLAYDAAHVHGATNITELLADASLVFSLVTADQAATAAASAASAASRIVPGSLYFDGNSCSPNTKRQNAVLIESAGGRYVDMAIMAPVHPKLHKTPILLSGPHAKIAATTLNALAMEVRIEPGPVGRASSIKMIRSVMVKGMEALTAECLLAARLAGVADLVLDSLEKSDPGHGWAEKSAYNLERMMQHGERRAAEMREVAATITDLGLTGSMASATVEWQQKIGALHLASGKNDAMARADLILAALGKTPPTEGENGVSK